MPNYLRIRLTTLCLSMAVILTQFAAIETLSAAPRLPNIFGDHMVLQRDKPVRVWGWANPGEKIEVRFAEQTKATVADAQGKWTVELAPLKASFKGQELIVNGKDTGGTEKNIKLADVLVGEVWLCGGQSNMEMTLRASRDADLELTSADDRAIRFIRLPKVARNTPQTDFPVDNPQSAEGHWRLATTEQVDNCTGVGYYFARRLRRFLKVPVGLVDTSWGGTMAQHWCTQQTLRKIPEVKSYLDQYEAKYKTWLDGGGEEGAERRFASDTKAWEVAREKARKNNQREPRRPNSKAYVNPAHQGQPGGMYNGVIAPISQFTFRGILFYQGENNSFSVSWKPFYRTFPAVIADWRKTFGDDKMPFGIVQIAGWSTRRSMTYDMNHHTNIVREVQFHTWQQTPGTGLIVSFDANTNGSIHPARKLPVGERSARWALSQVYGAKAARSNKPLQWRGPVYKSFEISGEKIVVSFQEGTGERLRLDKDLELGFYIAGDDRQFHVARARIKDNAVEVWSDEVKKPVAVRYAVSNLPVGSLMNSRELPAYPFRTDTWPLVPHQSTGEFHVETILKKAAQ